MPDLYKALSKLVKLVPPVPTLDVRKNFTPYLQLNLQQPAR